MVLDVFISEESSLPVMYKQVIIVRSDLQLPKGKIAAQAAHASVEATLRAEASIVRDWRSEGMMKIACKIGSEKELYALVQQAKDVGLATAIITDAGKTVVAPGTVTCGAIGPGKEDAVDQFTDKLQLL